MARSMCSKQIGGSAVPAEAEPTDARNGLHLPTHVDGTDVRRAEHLHLISQVVVRQRLVDPDPQCLVTRKSCQEFPRAAPRHLVWHDRTPVERGVQPKRLA